MLAPDFIAWLETTPDHIAVRTGGSDLTYGELAELVRLSPRYDAGGLEDLSLAVEASLLTVRSSMPPLPAGAFYVEIDMPAPNYLRTGKHQQCLAIAVDYPAGLLLRFFGKDGREFVDTRLGAVVSDTGADLRLRPLAPKGLADPAQAEKSAERMGQFVIALLDALSLPDIRLRQVPVVPGINRARAACGLPPALEYLQIKYPRAALGPGMAHLRHTAIELTAKHNLLRAAS